MNIEGTQRDFVKATDAGECNPSEGSSSSLAEQELADAVTSSVANHGFETSELYHSGSLGISGFASPLKFSFNLANFGLPVKNWIKQTLSQPTHSHE